MLNIQNARPMEELVLHITYGGLGDHLFWSHIPRAAKRQGIKRVYITESSPYRHPDYRSIWTLNPHVDGFTDKPPTFNPTSFDVDATMNLLDKTMLNVGVDDGERWHEPEFHYVPKFVPDYAGLTVYDPNYVSDVGAVNVQTIKEVLLAKGIQITSHLALREKRFSLDTGWNFTTRDLFDYADLIHSCERFLCLASGGATLAAALGKPAIVFHGPDHWRGYHHSRIHEYICVG